MLLDRSVPLVRFRISCPGLRKPKNRAHWGIRLFRAFLGRTTYSAFLLEPDTVRIGTTALSRAGTTTAGGVSSNEPDKSADLPEDLRGSRSSPRVPQDGLPLGAGRQAALPPHAGRSPSVSGQRDPGAGRGAADVASDAGRTAGRLPVATAPAGPLGSGRRRRGGGRRPQPASRSSGRPETPRPGGGYPAAGASTAFSSRMRVPFRPESTTTRSITACMT